MLLDQQPDTYTRYQVQAHPPAAQGWGPHGGPEAWWHSDVKGGWRAAQTCRRTDCLLNRPAGCCRSRSLCALEHEWAPPPNQALAAARIRGVPGHGCARSMLPSAAATRVAAGTLYSSPWYPPLQTFRLLLTRCLLLCMPLPIAGMGD